VSGRSFKREPGIPGRIGGTLFFAVFLGMGLLFVGLLGRDVYQRALTYTWTKTDCAVHESSIDDKGGSSPYQFNARFTYEWEGRSHTAHSKPVAFSDYGEAHRLLEKFPADSRSVCYVNPKNPDEAVLERESLLIGFMVFLPLIFVAIGAIGIYAMWKRPTRPRAPSPILLERKRPQKVGAIAFGAFFLIGAVGSWFLLIGPAIRILDARDWPSVPCKVLSSRVQTHRGSKSTTYRVDILYAYSIDGREHRASRYRFVGGASSGYDGKARVVAQYPPGAERVCYVNPKDARDAVLDRGFSPVMFFGLIPVVFLTIGLVGLSAAFRKRHESTDSPAASLGSAAESGTHDAVDTSPSHLKPNSSPMAKFIGGLIFSLFWNGIVSVFVLQAIQMWRSGSGEKWFLSVFLIPFVLVGAGMIAFTIHSFFGLFSPRANLRLSQTSVAAGQTVELTWEFTGRIDKLRELHLQLVARRERDEGSGKNRRTRRDVIYTGEIAHYTNSNDIRSGTVLCPIPVDQPPTDVDGANRVLWHVRLRAKVDFGADLSDDYPITVVASREVPTRQRL
jgi:hypothetical protein